MLFLQWLNAITPTDDLAKDYPKQLLGLDQEVKISSRPICEHPKDRHIRRIFGFKPGKAGIPAKSIYQMYCLDCGGKVGRAVTS